MARRLRIEYEGAIYHVTAQGNARQKIVRDDVDRQRLIDGLEQTVSRCGWELLCYVIMDTHFQLMFRTPRPNLSVGMQAFLSGYALWAGRRRHRLGHVFQGRYRADMIEDESHFWTVSRYLHLNPVRAKLVARPEEWEWSSYPGYRYRRRRQPWMAYDTLLAARPAEAGGKDPAAAYVRFVEAGATQRLTSPFDEAFGGGLGSQQFREELRRRAGPLLAKSSAPEARQLASLDPDRIFAAVAQFYDLDASTLARRHDSHLARPVAAWLCRRHTEATLRELAERLGLSRADSVPNLTRRINAKLKTSPRLARDLDAIMNQVRAETAGPRRAKSTPTAKGAGSTRGKKAGKKAKKD